MLSTHSNLFLIYTLTSIPWTYSIQRTCGLDGMHTSWWVPVVYEWTIFNAYSDISFSCIPAIELYETSRWSRPCTRQPCPFHRVKNFSNHSEHALIMFSYNGTPRGLLNCNQGGCRHCNGTTISVDIPYECVCLHAEENALLEAGRERVGQNAVLYCNTLVACDFMVLVDDII
jgi:hypothetical protein